MLIRSAKFIMSNTNPANCPPPKLPEYAFIGRSNVGKSSLLNMLVGRRDLAKTSGKPGKTQTINHFLINESWYLVDLPGYGYAKVSKTERSKWMDYIVSYLENRDNLLNLFVLIDSRIDPQAIDIDFIDMVGEIGLPFSPVFTKTDKMKKNQLHSNVSKFKKELLKSWETMPEYFLTSAVLKTGKEEILDLIEKTNNEYQSH